MTSFANNLSDSFPFYSEEIFEINCLRALLSISIDWNWQTNENLVFTWVSRQAIHNSALLATDIIGKKIWLAEKFLPSFDSSWKSLEKKMHEVLSFQDFIVNYINGNEQLITISLSGTPTFNDQGNFTGYVGSAYNLTNFNQRHQSITRIINYDPITGHSNWKRIVENFELELISATRKNKSLGFLYIVFPNLNTIYQNYSFSVFAELLTTLSNRIKKTIRKHDHICRMGLTDFCVVMNDISQESDIEKATKKIINAIDSPYKIFEKEFSFEIKSISLSAPKDAKTLEDLINLAKITISKD